MINPTYHGEYVSSPRPVKELTSAKDRGVHVEHAFPDADARNGRHGVVSGPTLGQEALQLGPLGRFLRDFAEDAPPDPANKMKHTNFVHLRRGLHV
jgi:hypothetical protein